MQVEQKIILLILFLSGFTACSQDNNTDILFENPGFSAEGSSGPDWGARYRIAKAQKAAPAGQGDGVLPKCLMQTCHTSLSMFSRPRRQSSYRSHICWKLFFLP